MSEMRHLKDVSYMDGHVRVNLQFAKYGERLKEAQFWLGNQVLADCKPYMPLRTGSQQQRSYTTPDGRQVVFPGPYARFLYMGKVMVDPDTGSPFARKGAVKIVTDRDLQFQAGTARWFDVARAEHGEAWVRGCEKILMGGSNG